LLDDLGFFIEILFGLFDIFEGVGDIVFHGIDEVSFFFANGDDVNILENVDCVILSSFYLLD
jgi:hypothetical protein